MCSGLVADSTCLQWLRLYIEQNILNIKMTKRWLFCFSVLAVMSLSLSVEAAPNFQQLLDQEWNYQMEQNPLGASSLGDRRFNDRWPDQSLAAIAQRQDHNLQVLETLKTVDRSKLSVKDQLNYDLFKGQYTDAVEGYQYHLYLMPLTHMGGIQTRDELGNTLRFETTKDYEDWIARMQRLPVYMDQTIALMGEGVRTRTVLPKVIMERVPAQIDKQLVATAGESPFYAPFKRFPKAISAADQSRLSAAAKLAITEQVIPSYQKFKTFFTSEYLSNCFDQVGIWQIPKGDAAYAYLIRTNTTTNKSPSEIHELGLSEVKRIRGEMQKIIDKVGFKGSYAEFLTFLRTDPRFYYKSSGELLEGYQATAKRIDPNLVKVFKTLPRTPYGVVPISDNIAPDTTTAYYLQPAPDGSRAGSYYVNLYKPEVRPKYEMMVLSLHESVPGHHLQIALAQELGDVPNFRRYGGNYTAFVEGWGLYSESLGEDMGLYDDPYTKFGQLTYEMWRAVRLVVDTGMHSLHWERQKAIDYFLENAAKQKLDVVNEIDRYIGDPGQALAYKIGELKIKSLRERAQTSLGSLYDIRAFHDVVLGSGAVPLNILERNVDDWIAQQKKIER
jgi:uncharacterized protein (DUF885 family)